MKGVSIMVETTTPSLAEQTTDLLDQMMAATSQDEIDSHAKQIPTVDVRNALTPRIYATEFLRNLNILRDAERSEEDRGDAYSVLYDIVSALEQNIEATPIQEPEPQATEASPAPEPATPPTWEEWQESFRSFSVEEQGWLFEEIGGYIGHAERVTAEHADEIRSHLGERTNPEYQLIHQVIPFLREDDGPMMVQEFLADQVKRNEDQAKRERIQEQQEEREQRKREREARQQEAEDADQFENADSDEKIRNTKPSRELESEVVNQVDDQSADQSEYADGAMEQPEATKVVLEIDPDERREKVLELSNDLWFDDTLEVKPQSLQKGALTVMQQPLLLKHEYGDQIQHWNLSPLQYEAVEMALERYCSASPSRRRVGGVILPHDENSWQCPYSVSDKLLIGLSNGRWDNDPSVHIKVFTRRMFNISHDYKPGKDDDECSWSHPAMDFDIVAMDVYIQCDERVAREILGPPLISPNPNYKPKPDSSPKESVRPQRRGRG